MGTKASTPHTSGGGLKCPQCTGNFLRRSAAGSAAAAELSSLSEMGMFSKTADDAERSGASSNGAETDSFSAAAVDFPQTQSFWEGRGSYLLLGSGIRYFKLGFVKVKVRHACSMKRGKRQHHNCHHAHTATPRADLSSSRSLGGTICRQETGVACRAERVLVEVSSSCQCERERPVPFEGLAP